MKIQTLSESTVLLIIVNVKKKHVDFRTKIGIENIFNKK